MSQGYLELIFLTPWFLLFPHEASLPTADFKLTVYTRLTLDSLQVSCLSFQHAGPLHACGSFFVPHEETESQGRQAVAPSTRAGPGSRKWFLSAPTPAEAFPQWAEALAAKPDSPSPDPGTQQLQKVALTPPSTA